SDSIVSWFTADEQFHWRIPHPDRRIPGKGVMGRVGDHWNHIGRRLYAVALPASLLRTGDEPRQPVPAGPGREGVLAVRSSYYSNLLDWNISEPHPFLHQTANGDCSCAGEPGILQPWTPAGRRDQASADRRTGGCKRRCGWNG